MISRKSLFRISIVFSVAFATIISGCRLPGSMCGNRHRCRCNQKAPASKCELHPHGTVTITDNNPYNMPQAAAGCQNESAGASVIVEPGNVEPAQPPIETEIESIPEVQPSDAAGISPLDFSSRSNRKADSTVETMAQLQPPIADSSGCFEPTLTVKSQVSPPISFAAPETPAPAPGNMPVLDPASFPADEPYYVAESAKSEFAVESFQPFPAELQLPQNDQPGAEFDKLAKEIFNQIDLQEKLELNTIRVPARPVSTEITPPQTAPPKQHEEIFGAIQFDAVLRKSASEGVYAQRVDPNDTEVYKIASLPPESKDGVSNPPPTRNAISDSSCSIE